MPLEKLPMKELMPISFGLDDCPSHVGVSDLLEYFNPDRISPKSNGDNEDKPDNQGCVDFAFDMKFQKLMTTHNRNENARYSRISYELKSNHLLSPTNAIYFEVPKFIVTHE